MFPRHYCCRDVNDLFGLCSSGVNYAQKTLHSTDDDGDDGDCQKCVESVSFALVEFRLSWQNSLLEMTTPDLDGDHWKTINDYEKVLNKNI